MDITSYKRTITELTQDLAKLEVFTKQLEMENTEVSLHDLNERIKNDRFNLAVLGEFRRGKSTLINALLRTPVLPSYIVPTTSSVNRITYDAEPRARVEYFDGTTKEISISELPDYATQDGEKRENVREVVVWYPTMYCANNVDIYDTPGLNDTEEMTKATTDVIDKMDVAIFTLSANVNFSASESQFLSEKLLSSNVGRVVFVVTRMGEYTPEEQQIVIRSIRKGIEEKVMMKAREVFSDRPEELEAFQRKLGEVQIFGVDSKLALEARKNHDTELLEKSGYPAFERAIDELLTRERGRVMLEKQTDAILKASNDIFCVIQTRMVPLTMDEDEFKTACEKTEQEIAAIQTRTDQEFKRLDQASQRVLDNAKETWAGYVEEIKQKIRELVNGLTINREDMKRSAKENFTQEVWKNQVSPMLSMSFQVYSEKIQNSINDAIGKECEELNAYTDEVAQHFENISMAMVPEKKDTIVQNLGATVANYFTLGIAGTMFMGYKAAGIKGALVGGLTGGGIGFGSAVAIGTVAAVLGMATAPAAVVGMILGSVIGLTGGKGIVKRVFWEKSTENFRKELADAACAQVDASLEEGEFEEKLRNHIRGIFGMIKDEITRSTLSSVHDMQKALNETKEDFAQQKADARIKAKNYEAILENLSAITDRTVRVRDAYGLGSNTKTR